MPNRLKEFFRPKKDDGRPSSHGRAPQQPGDPEHPEQNSPQNQTPSNAESKTPVLDDKYGLTRLSDSGLESRVDLVFVHGLTGKSIKTWRNASNGFTWPAEISKDIGPSRVITFGYDVDVTSFFGHASKNRLGEHAQNLIGDLARLREDTDTTTRPIIFVTHSLGGLVVQKALSLSRARAASHLRAIEECTIAVAFIGTPHAGADLAPWASIGGRLLKTVKDVNREILRTLERDSETLRDTQDNFGQLLEIRKEGKSKIQITCFYEELAVTGVGQIVPISSATLLGYDSYAIHANHMDMTKFGNNKDKNYERVLGEIKRWIKSIEPVPAAVPAHSPLSTDQQGSDCIKSLYFPEINQRMSAIAKAHSQTFQWFWSESEISFSHWLTSPRGLYWIQGIPGSGKSTLMKYVAQSRELSDRLCSLSQPKLCAVASYAFTVNSTKTAGSTEGLLRAILWQLMQEHELLKEYPESAASVVERYQKIKASRSEFQWTLDDLTTVLFNFLRQLPDVVVCIFVDGLDEYHGRDDEIAQSIESLNAEMPQNVRLVVAGRPYPDFAFQFHGAETFKLQEHTKDDIARYIRARFEDPLLKNPTYEELAQAVLTKAKGSFMWVKLACDELQRNWRSFQSVPRLRHCLNALPAALHNLYLRIFQKLKGEGQDEAYDDLARMLTILITCSRELTVPEFCHIFDFSRGASNCSSLQLLASDLETSLVDLADEKKIPVSCGCDIALHIYPPEYSANELRAAAAGVDTNTVATDDTFTDLDLIDLDDTESEVLFIGYQPFDLWYHRLYLSRRSKSAATCPHTQAYTCRSDNVRTTTWHQRTVLQINLIGRGLIQANLSSVTLSHETVSRFWNENMLEVWRKPQGHGQEILAKACISYLEVLRRHPILPETTLDLLEGERIRTHYPLLAYALDNVRHHCQSAEREAQCSQAQILQVFSSTTMGYWSNINHDPLNFRLTVPIAHADRDISTLNIALAFSMDLTAKDLVSNIAHKGLRGSDASTSLSDGALRTSDYLLWVTAGTDEPALFDELIRLRGGVSIQSAFLTCAPHRAVSLGNIKCLEAMLKSCLANEAESRIALVVNATSPTAATSILIESLFAKHLIENLDYLGTITISGGQSSCKIRTISLLDASIVARSREAFEFILSGLASEYPGIESVHSSLVTALYHRQYWAVERLLKAGADPNAFTSYHCQGGRFNVRGSHLPKGHSCCALSAAMVLVPGTFQKEVIEAATEIYRQLLSLGADPMMEIQPSLTDTDELQCTKSCFEDIKILKGVTWPKTPFLSALIQFSTVRDFVDADGNILPSTLYMVHMLAWHLQSGADLSKYSGLARLVPRAQRQWLEGASKKLYVRRASDLLISESEYVLLAKDNPLVVDLVDRGRRKYVERWQ